MSSEPAERVLELAREIKPRLRGWLHLGALPVCIAGGIVLVCLAPTSTLKLATGVFGVTAALLFGISALYHRGTWSPRSGAILRRFDHANIFLLIAGTYTPFAIALLSERKAQLLLGVVWGGALLGIVFRVCWIGAPRWLYLPVYLALGWAALFFLGDFLAAAGPAAFTMIVLGGCLYSIGGLVYGLRRPDPAPRWFGFHEVFHSFTLAGFAAHFTGISLVVIALH